MDALQFKLLLLAVGLIFVLAAAAPASAERTRKHRRHALTHGAATVADYPRYRANPRGAIYYGLDYLGEDLDPDSRFRIMHGLGAHYAGRAETDRVH